MHWAGAHVAEKVCHNVDDSVQKQAARVKHKASDVINKQCWDEDLASFTQAAGSKDLDASLLMLINMGFLSKRDSRSFQLLNAIRQHLSHSNGFLHRYKAKDDFGDTQNAFLICSFWLVEALALLGKKQEAHELFERLLTCSNHLGLYSEDVDPKTHELWGNFPQTYSHVGLINAAFSLSPHFGHLYLGDNFQKD
jgi:GH15 family glucan-1,4-alpha-glucosidase